MTERSPAKRAQRPVPKMAAPILWLAEATPLSRRSKCMVVGVAADADRIGGLG